jgi:hypothetical protein
MHWRQAELAEFVPLVDPLRVQLAVFFQAEGDTVPDDVDARMLVEEKCRLVFRRAAAPDRVEPAMAELVHILDGDHFRDSKGFPRESRRMSWSAGHIIVMPLGRLGNLGGG